MTTAADRRLALKEKLAERRALLVPGAANALTARVIEDQGFEACYGPGAGIANTLLGVPDIGLVTMSEIQATTEAIGEISSLPLIVDIDTGFGNAINTRRTVRVLERAGASALQIEDQVFPKRCGHFDGKAVIPLAEMTSKIKAAADARDDENLLMIARTDARAIEGLDAAIERAGAFVEAGADVTFVEAPTSRRRWPGSRPNSTCPRSPTLWWAGGRRNCPRRSWPTSASRSCFMRTLLFRPPCGR